MKRVKEIDIISFCPFKLGLDFIISRKLFDIISSFKLPEFNRIPVTIDSFNTEYFLVGFPMIRKNKINLNKSVFFDTEKGTEFNYKTFEEYDETSYRGFIIPRKIYLNVSYDIDIVSFQGKGLFFSERLIDTILDAGIIGLRVCDREMEM